MIWLLISFGFKNKGNFPFYQEKLKVEEKSFKQLYLLQKRLLPGFTEPLYLLLNQLHCMYYKKGLLAGILLLACVITHAQFKKGDKMAGASVASIFFNSGGADVSFPQVNGYSSYSSSYGVSLEPAVGWFVSENTVIGGTLIINPTGQKVRYEDAGTSFQED